MTSNVMSRRQCTMIVVCVLVMIESLYYLTKLNVDDYPGDRIADYIPPFIPILNDYAVASGYNLLGCNIRKSMSQLTFNIMCYLNNTEAFLDNNQSLSDTWKIDRISCPDIFWTTFNPFFRSGALKMSQLTKFAFVRHPEHRFASFFLDKCLRMNSCYNCTDVRCASKLIYQRLLNVVKNQTNIRKDDPSMWFEWHVAPQTWNCDFHENLSDFHLIPIGTSPEDRRRAMEKLRKVLRFAGVPQEHIEKVVNDAEHGDTEHSTYGSADSEQVMRQIRDDPIVRHYLHHTYYHDYVAFGFNMSGIVRF